MKRAVTHSIGLNEKDLTIFKQIGKYVGSSYIIARGSRIKGYWIETSDYDVVIGLEPKKRLQILPNLKKLEKELNIKIDFICSDKVFPSDGIMIEIK
jgi:predicted nucleotidyltransferase